MAKRSSSRQERTRKRNLRIMKRFQYLTDRERRRVDDALEVSCEEYCLSATQVMRILRNTSICKGRENYNIEIRTLRMPVLVESEPKTE